MEQDFSYLDDYVPEKETALSEVMRLVDALMEMQHKVELAEKELYDVKKEERRLREEIIPSYMKQHNLEELVLSNGKKVTITDELSLAVPSDEQKRKVLFSFIAEHGGGDLIKEKIVFEDADEEILNVLEQKGITYERSLTVNTNSLKAWMKRALGMTKGSVARLKPEEVPQEANLWLYCNTKITIN